MLFSTSIRIRPFNLREIAICEKENNPLLSVIKMKSNSHSGSSSSSSQNQVEVYDNCVLTNPSTTKIDECEGAKTKLTLRYTFTSYENIFWSIPIEHAFSAEPYATQQRVFEKIGLSAVDVIFSGKNAIVSAYGQTGSGKTSTIWGLKNHSSHCVIREAVQEGIIKVDDKVHNKDKNNDDDDDEVQENEQKTSNVINEDWMIDGLVFRSLDEIFRRIDKRKNDSIDNNVDYIVELECVEIYNEKYCDWLRKKRHEDKFDPQSKFRINRLTGELRFVDCSKIQISSTEAGRKILQRVLNDRTMNSVRMGGYSCRTCVIVTLLLTKTTKSAATGSSIKKQRSSLKFVDWPGSEKVSRSSASLVVPRLDGWSSLVRLVVKAIRSNEGLYNDFLRSAAGKASQKRRDENDDHEEQATTLHRTANLLPKIPNTTAKIVNISHLLRESIMIRYLSDLFLGKAKVFWVGVISPSIWNLEETLATLRMAQELQSIRQIVSLVAEDAASQIEKKEKVKPVTSVVTASKAAVASSPIANTARKVSGAATTTTTTTATARTATPTTLNAKKPLPKSSLITNSKTVRPLTSTLKSSSTAKTNLTSRTPAVSVASQDSIRVSVVGSPEKCCSSENDSVSCQWLEANPEYDGEEFDAADRIWMEVRPSTATDKK